MDSHGVDMASGKLDMVREDRSYYYAGKLPGVVELETYRYLTLDGQSRPGGKEFNQGIELLFSLGYRLKFHYKNKGEDFTVPRLECQWWAESGKPFYELDKPEWRWKLMIRMPEYVDSAALARAKEELEQKKELHRADDVKLEQMRMGRCVQMMHIGPYDREGETAQILATFMRENGLTARGPFHEVYLSDPQKTEPEKLKTIMRQPVR